MQSSLVLFSFCIRVMLLHVAHLPNWQPASMQFAWWYCSAHSIISCSHLSLSVSLSLSLSPPVPLSHFTHSSAYSLQQTANVITSHKFGKSSCGLHFMVASLFTTPSPFFCTNFNHSGIIIKKHTSLLFESCLWQWAEGCKLNVLCGAWQFVFIV